jgi:lipoate---protein ligase
MLIVERPQTDPYFNIAAEEYLLKNLNEDCFMLWVNKPSIIVGKHQNAVAEVNLDVVRRLKIPVIRRISGGGTVYHDLGNLNFSFIRKGQPGKLIDFSRFLQPIIEVLNQMGIPARHQGKNDIRVNGRKISGNSEHVHQNKVLHHGTLLFNSNLVLLNAIIGIRPGKFKDKSVKSIRSSVDNIQDLLPEAISISEFRKRISSHIIHNVSESNQYTLTEADISGINELADRKYRTWEWNFGYSPGYTFENRITYQGIEYNIWLKVKDGVIGDYSITSGNNIPLIREDIKKILVGNKHSYDKINDQILMLIQKGESLTFEADILLQLLFK